MDKNNLKKQEQQYQKRFNEFLAEIDNGGEFKGDLDKMSKGFSHISPKLQKDLNKQIQIYKNYAPTQSIPGFLDFIGKSAANSLLGPVGLSYQDFQNPQRLVDKAKKTALQSIGHNIASKVPNPSTIIRGIQNKGRDSKTKQDKLDTQGIYDEINDRTKILTQPNYQPQSYEDKMKQDFPDEWNRIHVIQNNNGKNFYSTYNILHEETNSEITDGLTEHLIKFHITNSDELLIFRMANFQGFTDSISVGYEDVRYYGRPESLKQYNSVSRNVAFSFDVVVDEQSDIYPIYKKLDILVGLCYPNSYTNDNIIQPNILKLSVGKYFTKMPFFPTSLTYTGDEEMVFSEGKPRLISVNVNGDILQPDSNPKLNRYGTYNSFLNTDEKRPIQYKAKNAKLEKQGDSTLFTNTNIGDNLT